MKKFITLLVIGGMFVFVTIQSASTKSNIDSLKTTSISKKNKDENKKSSDLTSKPQVQHCLQFIWHDSNKLNSDPELSG